MLRNRPVSPSFPKSSPGRNAACTTTPMTGRPASSRTEVRERTLRRPCFHVPSIGICQTGREARIRRGNSHDQHHDSPGNSRQSSGKSNPSIHSVHSSGEYRNRRSRQRRPRNAFSSFQSCPIFPHRTILGCFVPQSLNCSASSLATICYAMAIIIITIII